MTVTEGIETAKGHLALVLPEISSTLQLEELETPPFGSTWRFTFSGTTPTEVGTTLVQLLKARRVTKSVEIDPKTGDLLAVKNVAA